MYTAYVLDESSRTKLKEKFPPKYEKFIGHHVTVVFGVKKDAEPPKPAIINVIGYADSKDGLETLVVSVDGKTKRQDKGIYHITWSLDPSKYTPKDSNNLIQGGRYKLVSPITIKTNPQVLK